MAKTAITTTTAAAIRAVLCFIDPTNTPKIAYDRDDLAIPLINKMKEVVGDKDGSEQVTCIFTDDEMELFQQFEGVCINICKIFNVLAGAGNPYHILLSNQS